MSVNPFTRYFMWHANTLCEWSRPSYATGKWTPDKFQFLQAGLMIIFSTIGIFFGAQIGWASGGYFGVVVVASLGWLLGEITGYLLGAVIPPLGIFIGIGIAIGVITGLFYILGQAFSALWGLGK